MFFRISREVSKKNNGELTGTHVFGAANGYVRMGQRVVNSHIYFHKHIYNDMLLIATCEKLISVLHLNPLSYFTRGIRDRTQNTIMPCVVR
jgi:hypothetical protein